ncbi:uncharacterized protein LOC102155844 isoform X14 [Canis lupus familiaris]|uniref:uncharacterized protein LOC102155844 isoform X14 n=1 Tax=Canis lupus familiaris TaxID=9615 RepID=UPI000BAA36FC|nr:uncharacterized protein LOC102155844 isoform X14 [Canis lupus familiaris]|eukprot:XP_022276514.1 uncharacterized protein LOC102155844 isoform X5 [Canis lupus familiaris]
MSSLIEGLLTENISCGPHKVVLSIIQGSGQSQEEEERRATERLQMLPGRSGEDTETSRCFKKRQGRTKRRRKGRPLKGWRTCQSEVEAARKVLSLLQSPLGRHHDTTHFRHLLCPDPSCEVCNSTTAEVNRLLFPDALEDATPSVIPLDSTAPVIDSSFTPVPPGDLVSAPLPELSPKPPAVFSPSPMIPLAHFFLPSPPNHSLPLEPKALESEFLADHSTSPQPFAFPSLLPHDTQNGDLIVQPEATLPLNTISPFDSTISQDINLLPNLSQKMNPIDSFSCLHAPQTLSVSPPPDCTLAVTQSKSIPVSLKPVPENVFPDSPGGLSTCVPTIRSSDRPKPSISEFSCWQAHANNMFFPNISHSDFQQEQNHLTETYLWRDSAVKPKQASGFSFPGPNFQEFLETQMKRRMACQISEKKKREEGPFSKHMCSEYQWTSLGNSLQPHDVQVTTAPKTGWNSEGRPEQLPFCQQLLYVKSLGGNLHQKYSQLFWGLPSLHSSEGQGVLKGSHSDTDHKFAEDIQTAEGGSHNFQSLTHNIKVQVRPSETTSDNTCGPELSMRQAGAGHEPKDEDLSSSDRVETVEGKVMLEKNLEHFAMSNLSRGISDTKELGTLQSQSRDTLTTSEELGISKMINVNMSKVETALTNEYPSPNVLVPQHYELSDVKSLLLSELKCKLDTGEHNQAQGHPTNMAITSNSLTSKGSLTQSQSVCSRDVEASQMLHVHLEDERMSTEQQHESWDSRQTSCQCQPNNFPQTNSAEKVRPQGSKARKRKGVVSGVGTPVARKENHCVEDAKLDSASPSPSQKKQLPRERYLGEMMRQCFQWFSSKKKMIGQESPQPKAKFMSAFVQHQGLVESVATSVSDVPPEAHKPMTTTGKILEEKMEWRYESEALEVSQQQEELEAQVVLDPQHEKQASIKTCSEDAVAADQGCLTSIQRNRDRAGHPQKAVIFKDQLSGQSKPPSSLSLGEPVRQACQVLPATLSPGESTVFSDLTLLLKQKMLHQHFQEEDLL